MYSGPLYIASDHAGYQLKKRLVRYLENELNVKVEDMGPAEYDKEDDFPDYAIPTTKKAVDEDARAILICGSGIGVCIASNKVEGARSALAYNIEAAESARQHNNSNILCLAAKHLSEDHAMAVVKKWLETDFLDGKYQRRNEKIDDFEKSGTVPKPKI